MFFVLKIFISGIIIAFASWLAGKKPVLSGFIISLPLMSILAILFSYAEYRDFAKINQFATSILIAVPLSLVFFLPFVMNRWFPMNFWLTFSGGIALLIAAYFIHATIFHKL